MNLPRVAIGEGVNRVVADSGEWPSHLFVER